MESWKIGTYDLRTSKWKAGVRSLLIRNHLSPLEATSPSPETKNTIYSFPLINIANSTLDSCPYSRFNNISNFRIKLILDMVEISKDVPQKIFINVW